MSLLKKTFILQGQPPKGYLTALKIGATRGVKLSLNSVTPNMTLAVKIGTDDPEAFPIRAWKEEFRVTPDFDEKTEIRAVVFENESVFAYTGNSPAIAYGAWLKPTETVSVHTVSDSQIDVKADIPKASSEQTSQISKVSEDANATKPAQTEAISRNERPADIQTASSDLEASTEEPAASKESVYFEPVLKTEDIRTKTESVDAEVVTEKNGDQFRFFKKQTESHFYDRVRSRMEEMLVVHPKEESLEKLIPESKWVRVAYSQDEFYVVGILTDSGKVTHIGYGVKGLRSVFPPKEAEALSEFLPTEGDQGYWLMFQDAETGEMLPVD